MTIINDRIQFVADDFKELSDAAKAALVPYCGTNPFHSLLSDTANNHVVTAKRTVWADAETPELVPLVVNFRNATKEGKDAAVVTLDALSADLKAAVRANENVLDIEPVLGEIEK